MFRKGDRRGESKVWPHGYWELSSQDIVKTTDLAVHIEWLLDILETARAPLAALTKGDVKASISCFIESLSGHGGPAFSPMLLGRIASFELELILDIYFAS